MKSRCLMGLVCVTLGLATMGHCDDALPGVVFVSDDIFGDKYIWPGNARPGTNHWREGYIYHRATTQHPIERTTTPTRPGRNLYTLIPARPDGTLRRITHLRDGAVFDPEPSYDGQEILFSMRRDGEDWFNLYEINTDGTQLDQLTDGPFNDVSGVYLPDGRIVFVSDRAGYLEEYHEERTETLWLMNGDGSGIKQLTFNPGTVFDPTVLRDGRILYAFWDVFMLNLPGPDKHETYLMTIRPDGMEEKHFFGSRQYRYFNRERHSGVALNQATEMPDGTILAITEMGPTIVDRSRGADATNAIWPIFPGATTVQLGGATHRVHLSPLGSRSTPYALPDGRFLLSATAPGARDLGIYICNPTTRDMTLIFNNPNTAEFDPRPIHIPRPIPAVLPAKGKFSGSEQHARTTTRRDRRGARNLDAMSTPRISVTGRARFAVVNGHRSDNPEHEKALKQARYYRVIEALPTAVTSSSHTNLATRILGVVPRLPDGSAYFDAPANTPLFLEPLDATGRRIHFRWNHPVTSVPIGSMQPVMEVTYISARPGETRSCNGCHASDDEGPQQPNFPLALSRAPVQIQRDATDLLYRRNEPDEYRCQARIGEAPRYARWLDAESPELRSRACEMLASLEDGVRESTGRIVQLLQDESPQVRRAAALALGRLGGPEAAPALVECLSDADWQVRFHAAQALEGITGVAPSSIKTSQPLDFYRKLLTDVGGAEGLREAIGKGPGGIPSPGLHSKNEGRLARWCEAASRLGPRAPDAARRVIRQALSIPLPPAVTFEPQDGKRHELRGEPPEIAAIRAAGWLRDAQSVPLLAEWLSRYEYQDHITEVALALGRIGTPGAVETLWQALRRDVPNRKPYLNRYLQQGPRPEEYALLRGLILAEARPDMDDLHLIVALLPGSFLEKPRYEDRLRPESQRVLLVRMLFERAGVRRQAIEMLLSVLRDEETDTDSPLYQQILKGINIERPFAEHRRPFPVVERIEPEQALWFLGCLACERGEVPERVITPYLCSQNWRERIDAAVLLDRVGFGSTAADALARVAAEPYAFKEIMGIGKSHYDVNFRDKCYMVVALAHHAPDVQQLATFADPKVRYRDIRYGLAIGLGRRGNLDGVELLVTLATGDPISVIRRQARESLRHLQEVQLMAGRPVPAIPLPKELAYESHYPPRGLEWPGPVVLPTPTVPSPSGAAREQLLAAIAAGLSPKNYRDLNNANNQAPGAKRMMVEAIADFDRAVRQIFAEHPTSADSAARDLLDSPYPFAHFLACRELRKRPASDLEDYLLERLSAFAKSADTVGFFWTCEVLAGCGSEAAVEALKPFATDRSSPGVHGPIGMGFGYPAAKALARLAGEASHPDVARLLESNNAWLRAGALAGLIEIRAPDVEPLLHRLLKEPQPAIVRNQVEVGLSLIVD